MWRTFSPLSKLPPTFRAQTSQQESPESCSMVLSTSKQRQTRPFIPTLPPAFCKDEGAQNKAASTKDGRDPEKCPQDSGVRSCPSPWSKATRTYTAAPTLEVKNQSQMSLLSPCEGKGLSKRGQVWAVPPPTAQNQDTFKHTDNKLRLGKKDVSLYNIYIYICI